MGLPDLLEEMKNYLDITWEDEAGDRKLCGILSRGRAYLDHLAGKPLDYEAEGAARALLFDYCRYVRSGALDEFQKNYLHELLALQWEAMGDAQAENTDLQ